MDSKLQVLFSLNILNLFKELLAVEKERKEEFSKVARGAFCEALVEYHLAIL